MLDKNKLILELKNFIPKLYTNIKNEKELAMKYFNWLIKNPDKINYILNNNKSLNLISFNDNITNSYPINSNFNYTENNQYNILAIDGSQIYPDRNYNSYCFLLNIGFVNINYNINDSNINLGSDPYLFNNTDYFSKDDIDSKRFILELESGLKFSIKFKKNNNFILLLDGTLLFYYNNFFNEYLDKLKELYIKKIPVFGFISFTKNKDLVNILRAGIKQNIMPDYLKEQINQKINLDNFLENITDSDLVTEILKPNYRSIIFSSNLKILEKYKNEIKINFCYINIKNEIIRLEFPDWITQDLKYLNKLLEIIIDQCNKGRGYPISLALAHEKAVVKNEDREIFFKILDNMVIKNNVFNIKKSQKLIKKELNL